jgi:hypothetical protein
MGTPGRRRRQNPLVMIGSRAHGEAPDLLERGLAPDADQPRATRTTFEWIWLDAGAEND